MTKRTYASVTDEPCRCNYLQNAANAPDRPIVFDPRTNEYHFVYGDAMLVIYHCPFCGGAAPESKRPSLFAQIPEAEEQRLAELLEPVATLRDALAVLGKPDSDGYSVSRCPERKNEAPRIEHHRYVRYHRLSKIADVWITERADGTAFWQLQGKYLGADSGESESAGMF